MKILLPYHIDLSIGTDKEIGGIEKFIRTLLKTYPDVFEFLHIPKSTKFMERRLKIASFISKKKIDAILVNFASSTFFHDFGIPIFYIFHVFPGGFTDIKGVGEKLFFENFSTFVSNFQMEKWKKYVERKNSEFLDYSLIYPEFVDSNRFEDLDIKWDIVTIGRASKTTKNPFLVHELARKYGLRSLVITSEPNKDLTGKHESDDWIYLKNNLEKYKDSKQETILNLPHSEIYQYLNQSRVFVSTCNIETFGISALEAAQCGLPSLLNGADHHASELLYSPENCRVFDRSNFFEKFNELKDLKSWDIAEQTYRNFNFNVFDEKIKQLIDKIQSNVNNREIKHSLENFL